MVFEDPKVVHIGFSAGGAYGIALAKQLAQFQVGHEFDAGSRFVSIYVRNVEQARKLDALDVINDGKGRYCKPGGGDPSGNPHIHYTSDIERALLPQSFDALITKPWLGGDYDESGPEITPKQHLIFSVVPASGLPSSAAEIGGLVNSSSSEKPLVISATKGICDDGAFPIDVLTKSMPNGRMCVMSGPGLAKSIEEGSRFIAVVASSRVEDAIELAEIAPPHWQFMHSTDVRGVELCGILKNVYSMIKGAIRTQPVFQTFDAEQVLQAACILEMRKIIEILGGKPDTFMLPCGIGDFDLSSKVDAVQLEEAKRYISAVLAVRSHQDLGGNEEEVQKFLSSIGATRPAIARNVLLGCGIGMGHTPEDLQKYLRLTFEGLHSTPEVEKLLKNSSSDEILHDLPLFKTLIRVLQGSATTEDLVKAVGSSVEFHVGKSTIGSSDDLHPIQTW